MSPLVSRPRKARAFTLIELLVVIGIIALLAGAIGIGLRGGDQTVALQSGQATLSAMVSATRGRAAIAGANARLLVNANEADPDRYLRYLAVAVETSTSPSTFTIVGEGVSLPAGVYVVPSSDVPVGSKSTWPSELASSALSASPQSAVDPSGAENETWYYYEMTKFGTPSMSSNRFVLSTAERTETGIEFTNMQNVRGLKISEYGTVTLIDDAAGFNN